VGIANAAESIQAFTADRDLNAYLSDEMLRAAVERKFGIVGKGYRSCYDTFRDIAIGSHWSLM
jgi:uncharacterized protein with HEPN domain